jgi:hypothetical protein
VENHRKVGGEARFDFPIGVAPFSDGSFAVTEFEQHGIRLVSFVLFCFLEKGVLGWFVLCCRLWREGGEEGGGAPPPPLFFSFYFYCSRYARYDYSISSTLHCIYVLYALDKGSHVL